MENESISKEIPTLSPFTFIIDNKVVVTYNHDTIKFTLSYNINLFNIDNESLMVKFDDENIMAAFILDKLSNNLESLELYATNHGNLGDKNKILAYKIDNSNQKLKYGMILKYLKYIKHAYGI